MNLIIGGTHGLGGEIARELQARGEATFVTGRSYDEARHGAGMRVDLTDYAQSEQLSHYIHSLGDTALTGFYWVAGYGYNGEFAQQENEDVHNMALANLTNVLPVAHTAWQKMKVQGEPSNFVVVSSTTGVRARKNEAVYAATKHGQVGFGRSLGMETEWLETPVKVALFLPGGMKSQFWDKKKPSSFDDFMEPAAVARRIVERVKAQTEPFYEEMIERGSV